MILPPEPFAVRLEQARAAIAAAVVHEYPGDHPVVDQALAAQRDTRAMANRMASAMRNLDRSTQGPCPPDRQARILAAIMGCESCPHVETGIDVTMPTVACLSVQWVGCHQCGKARQAAGLFPDTGTPGRETWCDWCDTDHGTTFFRPLMMELGSLVLIGAACDTCVAALS